MNVKVTVNSFCILLLFKKKRSFYFETTNQLIGWDVDKITRECVRERKKGALDGWCWMTAAVHCCGKTIYICIIMCVCIERQREKRKG